MQDDPVLPASVKTLLQEMDAFGQQNDAAQTDHARRMLNLEPPTARLVYFILRSTQRRRILEIGTSNGYSTIWLAAAMEFTGGEVISIDRSAEKQAMAQTNLEKAQLAKRVKLLTGQADHLVAGLEGPFDAVFFDADRFTAGAQLKSLLPKLSADAILLADNALSHPQEIAAYREAVRGLADFWEFVVPVGKGLSIAYRTGSAAAR